MSRWNGLWESTADHNMRVEVVGAQVFGSFVELQFKEGAEPPRGWGHPTIGPGLLEAWYRPITADGGRRDLDAEVIAG